MSKIRKVEDSKLTMFRRILELQDCIEEVKEDYTIDEVQSFIEFIDSVSLNLKTIFKIDDNTNTNEEENTKYNTTSIPKLVDQFNSSLIRQLENVTNLINHSGNFNTLFNMRKAIPYEIEVNGDVFSSYNGEEVEIVRIETENLFVYIDENFKIIDEVSVYSPEGYYINDFPRKDIYNKKISYIL